MGVLNMWRSKSKQSRSVSKQSRCAAIEESQCAAEFLAVVPRRDRGIATGTASSKQPARTAAWQLKCSFLKLLPWSGMPKNKNTSKEEATDDVRKQAWPESRRTLQTKAAAADLNTARDDYDPAKMPAGANGWAGEGIGSMPAQEANPNGEEQTGREEKETKGVNDEQEEKDTKETQEKEEEEEAETVEEKTKAKEGHQEKQDEAENNEEEEEDKEKPEDEERADRLLASRASLARMARDALEMVDRQLSPWQQLDPMEELEREWRESIFVHMEHEHQQQLRRAIGLPRLPCPQ